MRLASAARASEMPCLAPPAISGHLRKLSEALGLRLFVMRGRHLVPTAAALTRLGTVHQVFEALERGGQTPRGSCGAPPMP